MVNFVDKTSTQAGTPINRKNMMALQGYQNENIEFLENGYTRTNGKGEIETTTYEENGYIKTFVVDGKTISIRTTYTENGYNKELI